MKNKLIILISFMFISCSKDNETTTNISSELVGIFEVVWIEEESNIIDFCPSTIEFTSDNVSEQRYDDDGDEICGNQDIRVERNYEVQLESETFITGKLGTGEEGVLSATLNGLDMMGIWDLNEDDAFQILFEYNKNSEELIFNLFLDANDVITYLFKKL